jgi:hypothetical protein
MRFAALRPYGNPNISDHWDIMYKPVDSSIQVLPYNDTQSVNLTFKAPRYQMPSLGKASLKG